MKTLNVGLIGYKFMGQCTAMPGCKAPLFFDTGIQPVRKVICGIPEKPLQRVRHRNGDGRNARPTGEKSSIGPTSTSSTFRRRPILHHEIAMAAAKAGKHIFCEKPIGLSSAQAREMCEAAERSGIVHYLNHNYRRNPAVMLAKRLIDEGQIGRIFHWRSAYLQSWIVDPGFPADLAPEEGDGRHGAADRPELPQRRSGPLPGRRDQRGDRHDQRSSSPNDRCRTRRRPAPSRAGPSREQKGKVTVEDAAFMVVKFENGAMGSFETIALRHGPQELQHFRDLRRSRQHLVQSGADERTRVLLAGRPGATPRDIAPSWPRSRNTPTWATGGRPDTSSATNTRSSMPSSISSPLRLGYGPCRTSLPSSSAAAGDAALSAHADALETRRADRREVPADRHPHQQLPARRHPPDLRPDAVQLGVAQPAHRADLPDGPVQPAASSRSSRPSRRPTTRTGSRARPTRCARRRGTSSRYDADYYLILAGDHLYRMDYAELVDAHIDRHADITIAAQPVTLDDASEMGIFRFDRDGQIVAFEEKPTPRASPRSATASRTARPSAAHAPEKPFIASMGIYVFSRDVLLDMLEQARRHRLRPRDHPGARSSTTASTRICSAATGPTSARSSRSTTPTSC